MSGPIRRASIARFLNRSCPGITVKTFPQGWTIATRTGASKTAKAFNDLLEAAAPHSSVRTWAEFDELLLATSSSTHPEEFDEYQPRPADKALDAQTVLTGSSLAAAHLRLTAFGLGIRTFDPGPVAVNVEHRQAPFRLLALSGQVLGSTEISTLAHHSVPATLHQQPRTLPDMET
ncbi:hypothetical protein E4J89_09825 [Arthrobacter sp. CAU 1506]|uniref:hypothetical protein n=1 Tax=Arthrobacter sp. CAU 1506 TaxID=2560052 RepID=UPI0010AB804B|nr:hypothetical protein [Arthrobacter sp. CAU 1506]TJY69586.1 hypothetical protein E4J89_09825 [Arthrobacter sp. CAU 1506]